MAGGNAAGKLGDAGGVAGVGHGEFMKERSDERLRYRGDLLCAEFGEFARRCEEDEHKRSRFQRAWKASLVFLKWKKPPRMGAAGNWPARLRA